MVLDPAQSGSPLNGFESLNLGHCRRGLTAKFKDLFLGQESDLGLVSETLRSF